MPPPQPTIRPVRGRAHASENARRPGSHRAESDDRSHADSRDTHRAKAVRNHNQPGQIPDWGDPAVPRLPNSAPDWFEVRSALASETWAPLRERPPPPVGTEYPPAFLPFQVSLSDQAAASVRSEPIDRACGSCAESRRSLEAIDQDCIARAPTGNGSRAPTHGLASGPTTPKRAQQPEHPTES